MLFQEKRSNPRIPQRKLGDAFIHSLQTARPSGFLNTPNGKLGDRSYTAYTTRRAISLPRIPPTQVGGSFIYSLHDEARHIPSPNPTNPSWGIVHIQPTRRGAPYPFPESHQPKWVGFGKGKKAVAT